MITTIVGIAGKAIIGMIMKSASETFFKEVLLLVADMAVKSTKTTYDDKLLEAFKKALEDEK